MDKIKILKESSSKELSTRYRELYAKEAASGHKTYLLHKISYKLQEIEYGGLSDKAKRKLKELIDKYDPVNNKTLRPNKSITDKKKAGKDKRLPIPGTIITKEYKGKKYAVKVLEKGFEYGEKIYKTLSAIAKEITGAHWNGYLFFNL